MNQLVQECLDRSPNKLPSLFHEKRQVVNAALGNAEQLYNGIQALMEADKLTACILLLYVGDGVPGVINSDAPSALIATYTTTGKPILSLARSVKQAAVTMGRPRLGIAPLLTALPRFCSQSDALTPLHGDICQLCLLAKTYSAAVPLVEADYYETDPRLTLLDARDVLLFSLYGGMVCIGRKQYKRALSLLLLGLTAPTHVVNAITVAIYRKYVLLSLLLHGEVQQLPKYTSSNVTRGVRTEAGEAYTKLVGAFVHKGPADVAAFVQQHHQVYVTDNNWGLVQQVLAAKQRRSVSVLTRTFLTLPLTSIASAAGLQNAAVAEQYVLRMVANGELSARISQREGMVRFDEAGGAGCAPASAQQAELEDLLQQLVALDAKVGNVNHSVSCDVSYLSKVAIGTRRMASFEEAAAAAAEVEVAAVGEEGAAPV